VSDVVGLTRDTYDVIADSYDSATRIPSEEFLEHQVAFAERVTGRLADLGCGPGRDLTRFGHLDVVGVDLSAGMLAIAKERGPVVQGDLRHPPLLDSSLDGIWSSASLLHVPRPDVPATLQAWHGLLRPGGTLGLSTSLGEGEGWEKVPYEVPHEQRESDERWFVHHDEDDLLALLREVGFTVERTTRRETHRNWLMVIATAAG
jgi:SAM-dependent methyltransferase